MTAIRDLTAEVKGLKFALDANASEPVLRKLHEILIDIGVKTHDLAEFNDEDDDMVRLLDCSDSQLAGDVIEKVEEQYQIYFHCALTLVQVSLPVTFREAGISSTHYNNLQKGRVDDGTTKNTRSVPVKTIIPRVVQPSRVKPSVTPAARNSLSRNITRYLLQNQFLVRKVKGEEYK
ncbi:unnamed protein product [Nezara viridula]|uniref:Uncharacterized protein n=1 Tax=Nezara viridula TaxID=85310 RepID=A0A9P0H470_NEZVI|nr:unnamed protein product [Nezara viridula]